MAGDCHNLLTLLKRVRGSEGILRRYGKDHNKSERSTDLPFSSSAEAILASQQGYFPDLNRFDSICFHIFKGDDFTLTFPINSPSWGTRGTQIEERRIDQPRGKERLPFQERAVSSRNCKGRDREDQRKDSTR